ncbi:MAG TPA: hypothetical protein VE669_07355 [Actinomycetota bacterium]|nr:hypothetical protein [Actinomycetota bacterium]
MPVNKGIRPGRQPAPQKQVERRGRECAYPGCRTRLSVYNRSERCWQHADVVFPNHRGKRLRIDRS